MSDHKILIVEDDENQRMLYEAELVSEGYNVIKTALGSEAIEYVKNENPDLVILDLRMPDMDGIEIMNKISYYNNQLPIIINTAYMHYKESFLSWSADAYVLKSSDLTELKSKVAKLLPSRF